MGMYVLDVSSWQSVESVKNPNVSAVIVKATQGTNYVNDKCNAQWDTALAAGKLVGLYHYAATNDPIAEAKFFISNISNYVGKGILALDWESAENKGWGNTNWAKQFIDKVHELTGVWCMLYTGSDGIKQCTNVAKTSALWYAHYYNGHNSTNEPWSVPNFVSDVSPWPTYTIWQWSSRGGTLDMSYAQLDKTSWMKIASPNSVSEEKPSTNEPEESSKYSTKGKSIFQMATDVSNGKVGNGDERMKVLGDLYNSVQAVVNMNSNAISNDTLNRVLANEVQKGRLGNGHDRMVLLGNQYSQVQSYINSSQDRYYTVTAGDTLSSIGLKLGISWVQLAENNGIKAPYTIYVGQHIKY